jgi:hypothetical protein
MDRPCIAAMDSSLSGDKSHRSASFLHCIPHTIRWLLLNAVDNGYTERMGRA